MKVEDLDEKEMQAIAKAPIYPAYEHDDKKTTMIQGDQPQEETLPFKKRNQPAKREGVDYF